MTDELPKAKLRDLAATARKESQRWLDTDDPSEYAFHEVLEAVDATATELELGERLGYGSNRAVYALPDGDRVVKVALAGQFNDGREQNRVETAVWNGIDTRYSERLFPVEDVADNHDWLVMPRATDTEGDDRFDGEAAVIAIEDEYGPLPADCEFLRAENIGWHEGRGLYALLDYGSHIPRSFADRFLGAEVREEIGEENIAVGGDSLR